MLKYHLLKILPSHHPLQNIHYYFPLHHLLELVLYILLHVHPAQSHLMYNRSLYLSVHKS